MSGDDTVAPAISARHSSKVAPASAWDTSSLAGLRDILAEDRSVNAGSLMCPANQALATHRLALWAESPGRSRVTRGTLRLACRGLRSMQRNLFGIEVGPDTTIGRRVRFMHHQGVVIGGATKIGDDVTIYHNVTIGMRWHGSWPEEYREPARVGNGVILSTGTTIVGAVQIGDEARIGPHSLVTANVPERASVVSPPSRVLRLRD